ncbi:HNH endonuclease signature motif containing protein [Brevibacterium rongguiense]|nr:HNH endonuclease signature motif containing protein [Brevibacterium rongguiense]
MSGTSRTAPTEEAGREPRPHRYDAAVFAAVQEATAQASRQRLRQLLGAGMSALDLALAHGDLARFGITPGMLLAPAEIAGPDRPGRTHSPGQTHDPAHPHDPGHPRDTGHTDNGSPANGPGAARCGCRTMAEQHDATLFELPAAPPAGGVADPEPEPDAIPWADRLPYDGELIPTARIRALLNLHAPDAVPARIFDGAQQRLGLTLAHCLDTTETRADRLIADALTAILGLPQLSARARCGAIDTRKLETAAHVAADLTLRDLSALDAHLSRLRPSMPVADFRRHATRLIATLTTAEDAAQEMRAQRRVEYWANRDGSANLCLIGPVGEVAALHARVRALARAVRRSELAAFGQDVPAGARVTDERTIAQLCFDMLASSTPQVTVQAVLPVGAAAPARDAAPPPKDAPARSGTAAAPLPCDAAQQGSWVATPPSRANAAGEGMHVSCALGASAPPGPSSQPSGAARGSAPCNPWGSPPGTAGEPPPARASGPSHRGASGHRQPDRPEFAPHGRMAAPVHEPPAPVPEPSPAVAVEQSIASMAERPTGGSGQTVALTLTCPTHTAWLRRQATVALTLPLLTYTGHADLPGELADGTPVPAEAARQIAAGQPTLRRLLTDPADGHVLDAHAHSYTIPAALRAAVEAKWQHCTAPGCSRRATDCELDHLTPFDRERPELGGRTDFDNLHPLCKHHHQLKTAGVLTPLRLPGGMLGWRLSGEITAGASVPGNPISTAHAVQLRAIIDAAQTGSEAPVTPVTPVHDDPPPF